VDIHACARGWNRIKVARAPRPRGLHPFVVGRSEGPTLLFQRAHARTNDIEERRARPLERRARRALREPGCHSYC
jgi:hypothetical protein